MNKENKILIDKARKMYPIGTVFISVHNGNEYTVVFGDPTYIETDGFYMGFGKNVLCHVAEGHGEYLYLDNVWAKVISYPDGFIVSEVINDYQIY